MHSDPIGFYQVTPGDPRRVFEAYPPPVAAPTDGPSKRAIRRGLLIFTVAVVGGMTIATLWWGPLAFIIGFVLGIPFAMNVRADIRPTWPF